MSPANKLIACYVTDRKQLGERSVVEAIRAAFAKGADWVQIREKDLPARELLALAREAVRLAAASAPEKRVLVNDRLDVALAAGAHGVHLGGESLPVAEVVRWRNATLVSTPAASRPFLVGASCHSVDEVIRAERDGADYVFLGPIFPTPSKMPFGPSLGIAALAEACRAVKTTVLAIGGITPALLIECVAAGASGFAAIRHFQER